MTEPEYEPMLSSAEAARIIGFSSLTVKRMAAKGRLPGYAFPCGNGKFTYRFRLSELSDYLKSLSNYRKLEAPKWK